MSKRIQTSYYTIPLSGTVSDVMTNKGSTNIGLIVSVPTSCTAFLSVSPTVNSSDFSRRMFTNVNPIVFETWNVGSGTSARDISDLGVFPYFRLETSVPMTAIASLTLIIKF